MTGGGPGASRPAKDKARLTACLFRAPSWGVHVSPPPLEGEAGPELAVRSLGSYNGSNDATIINPACSCIPMHRKTPSDSRDGPAQLLVDNIGTHREPTHGVGTMYSV